MTHEQLMTGTQQYLMGNYGRLPIALVAGSGAKVRDAAGREYIDLFAGFGAMAVGHCHPAVVEAIRRQAGELMCVGNLFTWPSQVELAESIIRHSFGDGRVFFCHSGAEANEAALKLARRAAGQGRYKMISFTQCFHGRTMGSLSMTSQTKFHASFEPMLPGCVYVPFNDAAAVEQAIDEQTAGIIVEPIQGEGGIHLPEVSFMHRLRELCDRHKLTLICDEVWASPARTAAWFGYQHYGITPDVITLGKALGGGVPVAACVARKGFDEVLTPGTHGCTLGGNPVCAAAGAAVMKLIEQEGLVERAGQLERKIRDMIDAAKLPAVRQVRGKGVMLGIEMAASAKSVVAACLEKGIMVNVTADTVVRLAPPLTIGDDVLEAGMQGLLAVLKKQ
jgi:acetylornithine/N-succinyldiaminopimelate aminotransferase